MSSRSDFLVLSDFDGTGSKHVPHPGDARFVSSFFEACLKLHEDSSGSMVFVTGRTVAEFDRIVGFAAEAQGVSTPKFSILSDHGAFYRDSDSRTHKFPLLSEEEAFLDRATAAAQEFGVQNPDVKIEFKPTSLVVYCRGLSDERYNATFLPIARMFDELTGGSLNPQNPENTAQKSFCYRLGVHSMRDTPDQIELYNRRIDKRAAVRQFGLLDTGRPALYMCDDLSPQGVDRSLATFVREKGGAVWHVLNGNPTLKPDDAAYPERTFASPAELGGAFLAEVGQIATVPFRAAKDRGKPLVTVKSL